MISVTCLLAASLAGGQEESEFRQDSSDFRASRVAPRAKIRDPELLVKRGTFEIVVDLASGVDPKEWLKNYPGIEVVEHASTKIGEIILQGTVRLVIDQRTLRDLDGDLAVEEIREIAG